MNQFPYWARKLITATVIIVGLVGMVVATYHGWLGTIIDQEGCQGLGATEEVKCLRWRNQHDILAMVGITLMLAALGVGFFLDKSIRKNSPSS